MSEELENSVREMLKEEAWTRVGINNFKKNNLIELAAILEQARNENCEDKIKEICDEQLAHSNDSNIIALYFSGMIALRQRRLDTGSLITLVDIFEKNHKEQLSEYLCTCILAEDENNKFALRKLAEYYKASNNEEYWQLYETLVKVDPDEADLAKALAERYESQGNREVALSYYKKALLRYVSLKKENSAKEMWSILVKMIPEEIDFFLLVQRKIAKSMSEEKSAAFMKEPYKFYKDTADWDTAIRILKLILSLDKDATDNWARKEIISCFREKYADNSHLDDYITRAFTTSRDVFESITDFEKHIAFDTGSYVFHKTWGVGLIRKVQGQTITINFGKKSGIHEMGLEMAVTALQPLSKDHIWVRKATKKKEELVKEVKSDIAGTLKRIIKSFENSCDDKRIKAELVPAILTPGEWTSWHAKAQQILKTDFTFGVSEDDSSIYVVHDREISVSERLTKEFKAEKDFFKRVDIIMRFASDDLTDKADDAFIDMYNYFASFLKTISTVDEYGIASYLVTRSIMKNYTSFVSPTEFTFSQLYAEIENPRELYTKLKDSKFTRLRKDFVDEVRQLADWDTQYVRLFPTVLEQNVITALLAAGKKDKLQRLVQDSFNDYRNYRDAAVYFFRECRNEDWFKEAGISYEKQLVTLVNIIFQCYKEIASHLNTTENKKTIKNATALLFAEKTDSGTKNNMLDYMLDNDKETISRLFTMVSDVKDLDPAYKVTLRKGILNKYPDFKFSETEIRQEAPKGILVTAKKLEEAKNESDKLEKVVLPEIAEEVAAARALGDLKENAEYSAAKERQARETQKLKELKSLLGRATVFDPDTITTSIVSFGTMVTLHNNIEDKDETYTILGPLESNPANNILSYLTPFAAHLLNAKVGDHKDFEINGHKNDVTITSITAANI